MDLFACLLLGTHWASWLCRVTFSSSLGSFQSFFFSKYFFLLLSFRTLRMHVLLCLKMSCISLKLVHFSLFVPSAPRFLRLHYLYESIIKVTDSFFCQFRSTTEQLQQILKFQLLYFLTPEFPFGSFFFLIICFFTDTLWWDIVIIASFNSISMVGFLLFLEHIYNGYFEVFVESDILSLSQTTSVVSLYLLYMGHTFLFLCVLPIFLLLKTRHFMQ